MKNGDERILSEQGSLHLFEYIIDLASAIGRRQRFKLKLKSKEPSGAEKSISLSFGTVGGWKNFRGAHRKCNEVENNCERYVLALPNN
jgi:hypothetical protein